MLGWGKQSSKNEPRSLSLCPFLFPESERNVGSLPGGGLMGTWNPQVPDQVLLTLMFVSTGLFP